MSTTTPTPLTDLGVAPPPPSWCLPGATHEHYELSDDQGGGQVAGWSRELGQSVWVACDDHPADGRVRRSEPRIKYWDAPRDGMTCDQARQLTRELIEAAEAIEKAAQS